MLFTVFQYLPLVEEDIHNFKTALTKKSGNTGSDGDNGSDRDNDSNEDNFEIFTPVNGLEFNSAELNKNIFYYKNVIYNNQSVNLTSPPPKI